MTASLLATYDFGGIGPAIVYAHATGFHARCWQPIARQLPHNHNVAYDARGHGDTPVDSDEAVNWETHGADAAAFVRGLEDNGPVLGVGHSMGGAALLMAALAEPTLFRGLVLYEPIVMPTDMRAGIGSGPRPDNFLAAGARKRRSSFASFEEAIANYSAKPPMNVFTPECLSAYVYGGFALDDDGRIHLKCRGEHEARTYEAGADHNTWDRLGELQTPVWVLCGLPEPMQPSSRMQALAAEIPNARYFELGQLGHFGPMQAPDEIAAIISSFPG